VFLLFGFGTKQRDLGPGEVRTCPRCVQHHAVGAGAAGQAVHGVLRADRPLGTPAARGLRDLRHRRRCLSTVARRRSSAARPLPPVCEPCTSPASAARGPRHCRPSRRRPLRRPFLQLLSGGSEDCWTAHLAWHRNSRTAVSTARSVDPNSAGFLDDLKPPRQRSPLRFVHRCPVEAGQRGVAIAAVHGGSRSLNRVAARGAA
jgi:hypothetical protein